MDKDENDVLVLNQDGTVTLPGGGISKVIGNELVEPIYGNQFFRHKIGKAAGTYESTALKGRANGIVQGYITIPSGMVGMKHGKDEATIILKDNHGPGGDMNKRYKVFYEYEKGGAVKGIALGREHKHPTPEDMEEVKYANEPTLAPGEKLEYKG